MGISFFTDLDYVVRQFNIQAVEVPQKALEKHCDRAKSSLRL